MLGVTTASNSQQGFEFCSLVAKSGTWFNTYSAAILLAGVKR